MEWLKRVVNQAWRNVASAARKFSPRCIYLNWLGKTMLRHFHATMEERYIELPVPTIPEHFVLRIWVSPVVNLTVRSSVIYEMVKQVGDGLIMDDDPMIEGFACTPLDSGTVGVYMRFTGTTCAEAIVGNAEEPEFCAFVQKYIRECPRWTLDEGMVIENAHLFEPFQNETNDILPQAKLL